jgi:hypothetical protein
VDFSLSGTRVVAVRERLAGTHELPKILLVDKGLELTRISGRLRTGVGETCEHASFHTPWARDSRLRSVCGVG